MNYSGKIFTAAAALVLCCSNIFAQEQNPQDTTAAPKPAISENAPMFRSEGEPRLYYIRDVNVHGVQYLNPEILKSSAGLIAGDSVYLPSNFISNAISRLWSQRFFSDVKIGAEIEGDSLDLEVFLKERPRVYNWEFEGISKGKKKDLLEKLHQGVHFLRGPSPVFGRERIERQVLHAPARRGAQRRPHGFDTRCVTFVTLFAAQLGPAAVAVHDDGDVLRYAFLIAHIRAQI